MESLASQAKPAAVLWLAGVLQAARLHHVVSFCASSRALSIRIAQCFLLNGFIFLGRYNNIAKHALDVVKSKSLDATQALDAHNITESEHRPEGFDGVAIGIGEQVYSLILLTIFFIEVSVIGYIPYLGNAMNFLLLSLMYAYYCFNYKWNFFAVSLNNQLDFFESNWAFFAGFGSPCVLPYFFFSPLASYGVMAILYPLFVLTAAGTQAEQVIDELNPSHGGKLKRIPVFFVAKRLTMQVLQLFPDAQKEQ